MVLMAVEFRAFEDEFVADVASDNQENNLVAFDIIQDAQVSCPKFKLAKRIVAETFDGFRGRRRLMFQSRDDCRFELALISGGQGSELPLSVFRDDNREGHKNEPATRCTRFGRASSRRSNSRRRRFSNSNSFVRAFRR